MTMINRQTEVIKVGKHKTIVKHPIAEIWFYDDENILNVPSPRIKTPEAAREFAHLILKCADLWEEALNKGDKPCG